MAKSLHPYREAKLTNCMITVGTILVIIMTIIIFIVMSVPSLA